jgi:hypothetical protein
VWAVEIEALGEVTAHLSNQEVHQMMLDGLRERGWLKDG